MARRELSPYVLVLRERGDEGRGYSMELAPLPGGGASPRAHGRRSSRESSSASPRAHGGSPSRVASSTGSRPPPPPPPPPPSARGRASEIEAASGSPRSAQGRVGSSHRAHGSSVAAGRAPRARGRFSKMEAATVPPRCARGGRKARAAAADGGGAAGGGDPGVADGDRTAPARERILRDMEDLLWPECARGVTLEELSKNGDRTIKNGGNHFKNAHEIVIPVFLAPKKKANTKKDDMEQASACIWHSSIRIIGICSHYFSFLAKMAYCHLYSCMGGHILSWAMGCWTGRDRDPDESDSSGEEDMNSSDLLQRLLNRH
ncbi:hypothetical protein QOZ80_7AG0557310 [Eleusine coracana subsp. coracana]|nr:hypothetical protein QOZ80_7AG0557310 [Eleusine coracana subsp. coracana]